MTFSFSKVASEGWEELRIGHPIHRSWEEPLWLFGAGEFAFEFFSWKNQVGVGGEGQICAENRNSWGHSTTSVITKTLYGFMSLMLFILSCWA